MNIKKHALALSAVFSLCWASSAVAQGAVTTAVFVQRNSASRNAIASFVQDPGTGELSLLGVFRTGGRGEPSIDGNQSHSLASKGRLLFVTNAGDNTISSFNVQSDGTPVLVSRVSSRGVRPVSLAVKKNTLLVVNQGIKAGKPGAIGGSVQAFRIAPAGTLTPIDGAVYRFSSKDVPNEVLSNAANPLFSVVRSGVSAVSTFWFHESGVISLTETVYNVPDGLGGAIKSGDQSTVIVTLPDAATAGVTSLQLNARGRAIAQRTYARPAQKDPCWAAIHPDGIRLWTAAFATRLLSLYTIGADGRLTSVSNYVARGGPGSVDLAVDQTGDYLFSLRAFRVPSGAQNIRPSVDVFATTGGSSSAGLSLIGNYQLPENWTNAAPTGVAVVSPNPV